MKIPKYPLFDTEWKDYHKAKKRLDQIPPSQAHAWAESSLWATQAALERAGTGDNDALHEARLGIIGVLASIDSLLDRLP